MQVEMFREFLWSPTGPYETAAEAALPNPPASNSRAFGQHTMNRLRVAGFTDASPLYVFLKHGNFLQPAVGSPRMVYVKPTDESQHAPGYGAWMGSPFEPGPTGNLAVAGELWGDWPSFGHEPGHGNHIEPNGP